MVEYVVVRYTKEYICTVEGETMAKAVAKSFEDHDLDETAWYAIEPYGVL